MQREFSDANFHEQSISCPKCRWEGNGAEAHIIDFYGVVADKEIHCPQCDRRIGILKKSKRPPGESATDLSFQIG